MAEDPFESENPKEEKEVSVVTQTQEAPPLASAPIESISSEPVVVNVTPGVPTVTPQVVPVTMGNVTPTVVPISPQVNVSTPVMGEDSSVVGGNV